MKSRFLNGWKWWRRHNIRDQIFVSMLFLTILAIGVLGTVSYHMEKTTIEENYRQSYETMLKNSSKILDLKLKPIIDKGRSILTNSQLCEVLENGSKDGEHEFSLEDQKVLERILTSITLQEEAVSSVAVMDFYGHHFFLSNINKGGLSFYNYYKEHCFQDESWYHKTIENAGKEVFWGEGVLGGEEDTEKVFCFTKILNNPSTGLPMGCMVLNLSRRMLGESIVEGDEEYHTSAYMIMDEDHDMTVYINSENADTEQLVQDFLKNSDKKYVFSVAKNETTGWSFVNAIAKNELSITSRYVRNVVFSLGGIIVILSFFLARKISKSITKPLKQLEKVIYDVGEGERNISEEFDDSEVGMIGRKFKEMVNTNLELSERLMAVRLNEREAELLLLQAQINPHFLYNTLDSIYCVAIIHGDDQIAEMILALSNNFKLSLNNGEKYISVADSIRRIEEYMKLQNMRYQDRFELHIEVQPEIMVNKIISFILQPFVENAMYHGLEPKLGKGSIWVTGKRAGKNLVFEIRDDGVGIQDLSKLETGYGIRNVKERIQLNYGSEYGVTFESEPGKGTTVRITIPEKVKGMEKHVSISGD